eukprot:763334-Hanusia_phi.AAC.3
MKKSNGIKKLGGKEGQLGRRRRRSWEGRRDKLREEQGEVGRRGSWERGGRGWEKRELGERREKLGGEEGVIRTVRKRGRGEDRSHRRDAVAKVNGHGKRRAPEHVHEQKCENGGAGNSYFASSFFSTI